MEQHYTEIVITCPDEERRSVLVAELTELGFDAFEETEESLKAYIPSAVFDETELNHLCNKHALTYSKSIIPQQNWNAVWESNFEPVQVGDFAGIRAGFHPPFTGVKHEIVITPKMSFGTGHHATTWLVMQMMEKIDFAGKAVFDFGTGTGILAILAAKLGARQVLAVDYDDWCIENASENISLNHTENIDIQKKDSASVDGVYDIILANINRNIILSNIGLMAERLVPGGHLVLSGLLEEDEPVILAACSAENLPHRATTRRNGWIAIHLEK